MENHWTQRKAQYGYAYFEHKVPDPHEQRLIRARWRRRGTALVVLGAIINLIVLLPTVAASIWTQAPMPTIILLAVSLLGWTLLILGWKKLVDNRATRVRAEPRSREQYEQHATRLKTAQRHNQPRPTRIVGDLEVSD